MTDNYFSCYGVDSVIQLRYDRTLNIWTYKRSRISVFRNWKKERPELLVIIVRHAIKTTVLKNLNYEFSFVGCNQFPTKVGTLPGRI